jgi:hypothetical protein
MRKLQYKVLMAIEDKSLGHILSYRICSFQGMAQYDPPTLTLKQTPLDEINRSKAGASYMRTMIIE